MKMKQFFALMLAMMLLALPCLSLAETAAPEENASQSVIGGADGPTDIVVIEAEDTEAEKPLSIGESLMYMVKGLVGIFLVTGMIIVVLRVLEKATGKKDETES